MLSRSHQTLHKRTRSASAAARRILDDWHVAMARTRTCGASEVGMETLEMREEQEETRIVRLVSD